MNLNGYTPKEITRAEEIWYEHPGWNFDEAMAQAVEELRESGFVRL